MLQQTLSDNVQGGPVEINTRRLVIKADSYNQCYVSAVAGNKGKSFRFLLDSGANDIAFDERDILSLGLDPSQVHFDSIAHDTGGDVPAAQVQLKELRIGGYVFKNITATINKSIGDSTRSIGSTILRNFVFQMLPGRCILTHPSTSFPDHVPAQTVKEQIVIKADEWNICYLDAVAGNKGTNFRLLLDSGADSTAFSNDALPLLGIDPSRLRYNDDIANSAGKRVSAASVRRMELRIGNYEIKDFAATIYKPFGASDGVTVMGTDILKKFSFQMAPGECTLTIPHASRPRLSVQHFDRK